MNKNLLTTFFAALISAVGYLTDTTYSQPLLFVGTFALSGALTNWLAIHMLFEKVPGLYGSGIVALRFEAFKLGIYGLMMEQFFTRENIERFFKSEMEGEQTHFDFNKLIKNSDLTPAFESLKETVAASPMGGMLAMLGGESALEPLREPFVQKMKNSLIVITHSKPFQESLRQSFQSSDVADDILDQIAHIVKERLSELTPQMVKEIIQKMIREHLGWLVVWGGVFGGLIGLVSSFLIYPYL